MEDMLITVAGPPGSGKSTLASALADELGLDHVSGGDIFRELAAERDMTPLEFNELAEEDESIDLDLDRRLRRTAVERDDLVLESRLAGWLAGDEAEFRIWLTAPLRVRAARVAGREDWTVEEAAADTRSREESEAKRYEEYYGIDIDDLSIYDLSINTARWSEEAEFDLVLTAVESHDPDSDEGKAPVEMDYDF